MKRFAIYFFCLMGFAAFVACKPNQEQLKDEIMQMEDSMIDLSYALDSNTANHIVGLYLKYADAFPKDSLAPVYLFKAADVMASVGKIDSTIICLDRIVDEYPNFEDLGGCYFLKGYVYESYERFDEAKAAYQLFVDEFPDHPLAADTRAMLPYIGMSPDQMLEQVLAKSEETALALSQK